MVQTEWFINILVVVAALWRFQQTSVQDLFDRASGVFFQAAVPTVPAESTELGKEDRVSSTVLGSLLGDALALQTHYEYNYRKIRDFYRINLNDTVPAVAERLRANAEVLGLAVTPGFTGVDMRNWHPGKKGGDLTDYGDCVVMTLEYLAAQPWSLDSFHDFWLAWMQNYQGYVNMATKAILEGRAAKVKSPGRLGWPAAEDFFGTCRVPALIAAFRDPARAEAEPCRWSEALPELLEPFPPQLAQPFLPPAAEKQARLECESLGGGLCGGVTCWKIHDGDGAVETEQHACALLLPAAQPVAGARRQAWSRRLTCPKSSLWQAAMEAASIQYATETSLAVCYFLALLTDGLLQNQAAARSDLLSFMRRMVKRMQLRGRRLVTSVIDAVEEKVAEVEEVGADWAADTVERDDLAIRSFTLTKQGLVKSLPYPCKTAECPYWGDHGKASPMIPGLTAVLYLLLRYAKYPMEHALAVNALLGGDSAARGVVLGMLLGALHDPEAIPQKLLQQLNAAGKVRRLLKAVEPERQAAHEEKIREGTVRKPRTYIVLEPWVISHCRLTLGA